MGFVSRSLRKLTASTEMDRFPHDRKETKSGTKVPSSAKVPVITIQGPAFLGNLPAGGFRVKIQQGVRQLTLYRMFTAALVYDRDGLSLEGCIALFDLQGRLEQKLGKDPQFTEAYSKSLDAVCDQLSKLRFNSFPVQPSPKWKEETAELLRGFLPGPNDYYGWVKGPKSRSAVRIIVANPLKPPRKRPQRRVIGVGYKDSGNRRNPAQDGISWSDIMKANPDLVEMINQRRKAKESQERDAKKANPRGRGRDSR
jgi:hypothetical protein